MSDPQSSSLLWNYFSAFFGYTSVVVFVLLGLTWLIKKHPERLGVLLNRVPMLRGTGFIVPPAMPQHRLVVEESLALEPQKTLYVVRYEGQRYLVATGMAETTFLTRLDPAPGDAVAASLAVAYTPPPEGTIPVRPTPPEAASPVRMVSVSPPPASSAPAPPPRPPVGAPASPAAGSDFFHTLRQAIPAAAQASHPGGGPHAVVMAPTGRSSSIPYPPPSRHGLP